MSRRAWTLTPMLLLALAAPAAAQGLDDRVEPAPAGGEVLEDAQVLELKHEPQDPALFKREEPK